MATDRLGSILAFVRVAEAGSFAKAAKALGVSSSAVSKSVARLEERLEIRLLQRTTRALTLTEEGHLFFLRCEKLLSELDDAERSMRDRATNPAGILKVGLPAALGRLKILPALGMLTARYPALRIDASFDDRLTDLIDAGLDAVVRIGEPRDTRLMVRRVGTVRYIVCAAPSYIASHGKPLSPDDLDRFVCIRRVQHCNASYAEWKFASPQDGRLFERKVTGALSFDSNDAIVDAGVAGNGLVQLHTYMAEAYLKSGQLVQVLSEYASDGPPISVLFPSNRQLAPKVRVFIDFVASILAVKQRAPTDHSTRQEIDAGS